MTLLRNLDDSKAIISFIKLKGKKSITLVVYLLFWNDQLITPTLRNLILIFFAKFRLYSDKQFQVVNLTGVPG